MEQYYIKVGRRYVPAGYSFPDMPEGLYWKEKMPGSSRVTSVMYWAGKNPPQPLDVEKLISIMREDGRLAKYIMALTDENSEEYKEAKENQGGFVKEPLNYNWSAQDLATCILRFAFKEI